MIPARLMIVLASGLILSGACHRSLGPGARDAAAADEGSGAGGGAGSGASHGGGGQIGAGGGDGSGGRGVGGAGGTLGGAGGTLSGAGGTPSGVGGAPGAVDAGGDAVRDAGGGVTYAGCSFIGAYDHINITKRDPARGVCVSLMLISPVIQAPVTLGLTLPGNWSVQQAAVWDLAAGGSCSSFGSSFVSATSGAGTVVIHSFSAPATIVDLDLTLSFPGGDAAPRTESMVVHGFDACCGC